MSHRCFTLLFVLAAFCSAWGLRAVAQAVAQPSTEAYVMLPEPSAMRSAISVVPTGAKRTVLTPARQTTTKQGVEAYSAEEFKKIGISVEAFQQRAERAAEDRLSRLQAEFIKDDQGKTRYAVFRGESSLIASLIIAPSLPKQFKAIFGEEVWAALPDRHSLYIFPPKPELLVEFTEDLASRYNADPYAASCEVFSIKEGRAPVVVADFGD
jgi:hypothetical protein